MYLNLSSVMNLWSFLVAYIFWVCESRRIVTVILRESDFTRTLFFQKYLCVNIAIVSGGSRNLKRKYHLFLETGAKFVILCWLMFSSHCLPNLLYFVAKILLVIEFVVLLIVFLWIRHPQEIRYYMESCLEIENMVLHCYWESNTRKDQNQASKLIV